MRLAIYEIREGDEPHRLAHRLLGDFRRWTELVELNRLDPPYIANDPAPYRARGLRVLGPGDRLLYPYAGAVEPVGEEDAEAETYGRDLLLQRGELALMGGTVAMVRGLENLRGALERRLRTRLGELPAHPDTYGHLLHQYVGRAGGEAELRYILLEAERVIRQDPRVAGVRLEGELLDGEHVRVLAYVEPIPPGSPFPVEVVL
ncbi:hypothetical protein CSW25_04145 [Thermus scotoductus]|uniref:Uncharacterized protein n=1 Tax=Thermus scotoductus TaxID=37636 RepID=A0A430R3S1_THESC|nr:DUF2634 domain-containing protein [Thermus scotoductus]RTG94093.1 hypothetical protein CSW49_09190 [Thermus scotoductus]RTH02038.1 hypothetical protein CSW45_08790 [Thermus scotoductus]RTH07595.1 hypothetical protein CSW46_09675 [Thermus scotoductus]RTH09151.1 hypothetical protein CSW44_09930 [Thermus scotoductus]RTH16422.1 hypothetical protein CSW39_09240 [Thermus scotoductus]